MNKTIEIGDIVILTRNITMPYYKFKKGEHVLIIGYTPFRGYTYQTLEADNEFRSEERRVGKECVSTCKVLWSPLH